MLLVIEYGSGLCIQRGCDGYILLAVAQCRRERHSGLPRSGGRFGWVVTSTSATIMAILAATPKSALSFCVELGTKIWRPSAHRFLPFRGEGLGRFGPIDAVIPRPGRHLRALFRPMRHAVAHRTSGDQASSPCEEAGKEVCVQTRPASIARCGGCQTIIGVVGSPVQPIILLTRFDDREHVGNEV